MAPKVPASLVRHLQNGRCVLFAGAGLSAQAKLPDWGKLLGQMVQTVGAEDPDEDGAAELAKLLQAGRYLDVADECKERLGAGYAEILSRALQVGSGPVPEAHRLVMELPFAAWITTNYDKLLEQAHFQVRGGVPKTLTHLDADTFGTLLFDGAPFILKAHGDVDKPESLIFTTRDYREIIHANPAFNAVFSAILLTRAVLFVGYSLNDPDFRLLLDRQLTTFKKFVPERYAIMSGVGEVEREVLRRTAQIKVIPYPAGQHEELVAFLRALQEQVAPRPASAPAPGGVARRDLPRGDEPPPPPASRAGASDGIPRPAAVAAPAPPRLSTPPMEKKKVDESPPATVEKEAGSGDLVLANLMAEGPDESDERATEGPVVLALTSRGSRIAAVLRGKDGEVVAQGTGPPAKLPGLTGGDAAAYRQVGAALAEHLPRNVMAALALGNASAITLELDPELEMRPWELLEVRGKPLVLGVAVTRASMGLSDAARGRPMLRRPVHALFVGDPDGNVPDARVEVDLIAGLYRERGARATVLAGRDATAEAVIAELGKAQYDIVHFAGSAWYDAQDAYLMLDGGERLTDDAIRPVLSHRPPAVLVLNSHYTAFVPAGVRPQGEGQDAMKPTAMGRVGFMDVAMRAGVGAFLGTFGSPPAEGARTLAMRFHRGLLDGYPVAQILFRARSKAPAGDLTPLLYTLSGYGDLTLEL